MLRKPDACKGCPLYDDGFGWVPDELVSGARTLVVLQNPGSEEERRGKPAVGATGDSLNGTYLPAAGLTRGVDVSVGNALRCRWRGPDGKRTNKLPGGAVLQAALKHCRVHDQWDDFDWIMVCGAAAMSAVGGAGKVSEWRGFVLPNA